MVAFFKIECAAVVHSRPTMGPSMTSRSLGVLAALCAMSAWSHAASCLHYEATPVTLSGKITLRTFYGPPNYGENPDTDSRETQAILLLSKPICVSASPSTDDAAERNQFKVTLVPPPGIDFGLYKGKKVSLSGTLFHANTGHHHTQVLMQVKNIEVGRE